LRTELYNFGTTCQDETEKSGAIEIVIHQFVILISFLVVMYQSDQFVSEAIESFIDKFEALFLSRCRARGGRLTGAAVRWAARGSATNAWPP
jgi:hypothetical protein